MRKPFLATTALEDFWDDTRPLLFLGEWCLLYGRRHVWKSLRHRVLPSLLSNQEKRDRARSYVTTLYDDLLVRLGTALNDVHAMPRSLRYWRIVLGPWLYLYLSVHYERYSSLCCALEVEPELVTCGLDRSCFVTPGDTYEFVNWLKDDAYNLQIYTRLWQAMGMSFPVKALSPDRYPTSAQPVRLTNELSEKHQRLVMKQRGSGKIVLSSSYFPRGAVLRLMIQTAGKVIPVRRNPRILSKGNLDRTSRYAVAAVLPTRNSFERAVAHILAEDLPRCFVEDFATIGEAVARNLPLSPKAILSASWFCDEVFSRWAAEAQECGTKLLGSQHGGNYGLLRYHPGEHLELPIVDRFYSWGWSSNHFQEKIVPMPAGKLMGRKMLHADNRNRGILWGTTCKPRYSEFLWDIQFSEYLAWQARFLAALPATLRKDIRLRPHVEDGGWAILQRLHDQGLIVRTEDWNCPFYRSLDKCRLYVCDHLSTTFIEALSANKPTVLFCSPRAHELSSAAISCCEALKSAGILFETPEEAAATVDVAYADVEGWWRDPHRQSARKIFCQKFGRTSPTAQADWARELTSILKSSNV